MTVWTTWERSWPEVRDFLARLDWMAGDDVQSKYVDNIIDAIGSGRKVEAIKHYRIVHNAGLKEAKKAIEVMQQENKRAR